jgi:hypothetical protein
VAKRKKITIKRFQKAWKGKGGITGAERDLGYTRMSIYRWCRKGEIPEYCDKYPHAGDNIHDRLRTCGLNPLTLEPLDAE